MKSSFLRAGLALLCGVILSACGGSNGSLALSGYFYNSTTNSATVVLTNKSNGDKLSMTMASGQNYFVFGKLLATDEKFDVGVETPPVGSTCVFTEASGTASYYTVGRISIVCTANPFVLGGTVKGLTGTGLVLANGADTVAALPASGADVSFKFPTTVANTAYYGVTVLAQPAGQTCTVNSSNNPGTMPEADLLTLVVNCTNNT